MITFKKGDIFDSDAKALVNPVNCVGVMAAGLAAKFKDRFPFNYTLYRDHCFSAGMKPGTLFMSQGRDPDGNDRIIINFATKQHWKGPSEVEWIDKGMWRLRALILQMNIRSIAIPALGCGLGGLVWFKVKPYIVNGMDYPDLKNVDIQIYEPK